MTNTSITESGLDMIDRQTSLTQSEIEAFIEVCLQEPDGIEQIRQHALENHVPVVSKTIGNFLQLLIRIHQPERILEIGTGYGLSARLMLEAGNDDLMIDTIEIDSHRFDTSGHSLAPFANRVRRIYADVRDETVWAALNESYDMVFIDAAKGQYETLINRCLPQLRPGGCIILADVFINGWVVTGSYPNHRRKTSVLRMRKFLTHLHNDTRFYMHLFGIDDGVVVLTLRK